MNIAGLLTRWHRPIVLLASLLAVASVASLWSPGLSDDYSLRSFAGSNTKQFDELERFVDEFAGVELAILVVRSDAVLSPKTQECLARMVSQAQTLPAVDSAACISQAPGFFRAILAKSSVARGLLVSDDGKTASVILQMRDDSAVPDTPRSETVAALKQIVSDALADYPGHEVVITGPYVVSYEMTHLVWADLITFGQLGAIAALVVLMLSLGSFRLAVYPLLVGIATVALALGASVALGVNTALNLPMLVLLSAVLTIANCVHLAVGHDETRGAAETTIWRLLRPCCGVVATTIVGFAAVAISPLEPVRSFALLMAIALSIGLVLSLTGACVSLRHHSTKPLLANLISRLLRGTLVTARSWPTRTLALFVVVGAIGAAMTTQLEFNLRFLDNFRPDDEIRSNYEFVQETLTPMQSIELLIDRPGDSPTLTPQLLAALDQLAVEFEGRGPITRAVSVVDFLSFGGWQLPDTQANLDSRMTMLQSSLKMLLGENPLSAFVSMPAETVRISFFATEGPNATAKIELGDEIRQRAEQLLDDTYQVRVTGLYYFYAHVASDLLRDQAVSLVASVLGVFITMAWVLRSVRLALVGMAPPLFAGAACVGLMALFSVPFNTVTSMMLAIALGIAVDDTIHYLWRYRICRRRGRGLGRAIAITHLSVGRACTLTSLVLAAGFAVMGFSRFLPIAYFGCVISAVMAIALAANLLLLPALLFTLDGWLAMWRRRHSPAV